MKTLLLLRHAKATESHHEEHDHARPLQTRGKRDAEKMGKHLQEQQLLPEMILSSNAKRCRRTAEKVAEEMQFHGPTLLTGELYLALPAGYLKQVQKIENHFNKVLVVGHNPSLETWLEQLVGEYFPMCTGSLAVIELPELNDWADLTMTTRGVFRNFWQPQAIA